MPTSSIRKPELYMYVRSGLLGVDLSELTSERGECSVVLSILQEWASEKEQKSATWLHLFHVPALQREWCMLNSLHCNYQSVKVSDPPVFFPTPTFLFLFCLVALTCFFNNTFFFPAILNSQTQGEEARLEMMLVWGQGFTAFGWSLVASLIVVLNF